MTYWKLKRQVQFWWIRKTHPRRVLKFVLGVFVAVFVSFVVFECLDGANSPWIKAHQVTLGPIGWVALIGGFFAAVGWQVSTIATMRNSVKQHTISTLLQMRVSDTYLKNGDSAWAVLRPAYQSGRELGHEEISTHAHAEHVYYLLNYFEFLAVAILHGDLDEKVLKHTIRGFLVRTVSTCRAFIRHARDESNSKSKDLRSLEHVVWLYGRWFDPQTDAILKPPQPVVADTTS